MLQFIHMCVGAQLLQSCLTLCYPMDWIPPGSSRQDYWSGLPFPPGDLPNPETEPMSPLSSCIVGRFFTAEPPGKPRLYIYMYLLFFKFFSHLGYYRVLWATVHGVARVGHDLVTKTTTTTRVLRRVPCAIR